jgi:hypothetical protein
MMNGYTPVDPLPSQWSAQNGNTVNPIELNATSMCTQGEFDDAIAILATRKGRCFLD